MKRFTLPFIFILIVTLASACGRSAPVGTDAPAQPVVTDPPAQLSSTESPAQPLPTEAPTQPVATTAPSDTANSTHVEITLADNTIKSTITTFQVGVPYTFIITNTGRHAHNFNISTPVSTAGSLNNALTTALLTVDQSQLDPRATVTVDFTFPESVAGAQLEFSCLIRKHYEDGMFLPITVTK